MAEDLKPKRGRPSKEELKAREEADRSQKIVCMNCGCKNQANFYKSQNPFNKHYGKIPYCKDCIKGEMWQFFLKKYDNKEQLALHALLRSLNLPYIQSVYDASVKNINNPNALISTSRADSPISENTADNMLVSAYMKNYNSLYNQNNYGDSYLDSEGVDNILGLVENEPHLILKHKKSRVDENARDEEKYEYIEYDADELIDKWGEFDD
jgi:hypothetical protein